MEGSLASDLRPAEAFARDFGASAAQVTDLQSFHDLLLGCKGRMNLVGPSAMAEFWPRHVLDCAQLLHVEHSAIRWVDVGAGAGFPGIILAILLKGYADACVHLVESMAKRVGFLVHVSEALSLPVVIHHTRAEALPSPRGLQMVTARACAPFPRLFNYTAHFFDAGAEGLFLKGRDVESELTIARRSWTFDSDLIQSQSDPAGRLVRIRKLEPRG